MKEFRLGDAFPPTPEGFHLRMKSTLDGLKEEPMKTRHKIGTVALVAAAALLLLIGTALAAGYFSGEIDWTGKKISEDTPQEPYATPTPAPSGAEDAQTRAAYEDQILDGQPEGEYWEISWEDHSGSARGCQKTFSSLAELNEFLGESGTPFLRMTEAPDGYTFEAASCEFYFTADILDRAAVETEALAEGAALTKVKPGAGIYVLVSDYSVDFRGADGSYLSLYADLSPTDIDEYSISVSADESYEVLDLPNMAHALFLGSEEYRHVAAIAQIPEMEGFFHPDQYWDGIAPDTFAYIDYTLMTNRMTRDALISLAESLK